MTKPGTLGGFANVPPGLAKGEGDVYVRGYGYTNQRLPSGWCLNSMNQFKIVYTKKNKVFTYCYSESERHKQLNIFVENERGVHTFAYSDDATLR